MTPESVFPFEGRPVPNFHGAILRCRGHPPAIGAEGRRQALAAELSPNGVDRLPGFRLPKRQLTISTHGDQTPAIRTERHVPNPGVRSRESPNRLWLGGLDPGYQLQ